MADLEKIAEDLSALTVLEAAELAKILEEKWGVSAAAPVAVAAVSGVAGDADAAEGESDADSDADGNATDFFFYIYLYKTLQTTIKRYKRFKT